jgi:hypothetical protein
VNTAKAIEAIVRELAIVMLSTVSLVSCAATTTTLEPRYVAIHNALVALGMTEVGPIRQGSLGAGKETRVPLGVVSGCMTVAVVGGDGVADIDATLIDASGHPQAHDTTNEPQAVLSVCPESPQSFDLLVRVAAGGGAWVSAVFQGGGVFPRGDSTLRANADGEKQGTCDTPIPLTEGMVTGSTIHGEHEFEGSCAASDAREIVYRLDVPERANVTLDLESHFDGVLYVRSGDCSDGDSEIACDDDSPDQTHSRVSQIFEAGTYFVFVDGYTREGGTYKLTVTFANALSRLEVCEQARFLVPGQAVNGSTEGSFNSARATCAGGAEGADTAWRLDVRSRSRIRITERAVDDFVPVLHMRRACPEEATEVACSDSGVVPGEATVIGVFDPGTYFAFADAREKNEAGQYVIESEVAPLDGEETTQTDGCGEATPLRSSPVSGDTFAARDDFAASCAGVGAPDVVYRVDVARRSRFMASLSAEESAHVLSVSRRCGDRAAETACGATVDEVLAPGSYFVAVDGSREESFGRFTLAWHLQDLTQQPAACTKAPEVAVGSKLTSTTVGSGNVFSASCLTHGLGSSGPDRLHRLVLASRKHVRISVRTQGFDVALSLRKSCVDGEGSQQASEIACAPTASQNSGHLAVLDRVLERGTYWVLVDGASPDAEGPFVLSVDEAR